MDPRQCCEKCGRLMTYSRYLQRYTCECRYLARVEVLSEAPEEFVLFSQCKRDEAIDEAARMSREGKVIVRVVLPLWRGEVVFAL